MEIQPIWRKQRDQQKSQPLSAVFGVSPDKMFRKSENRKLHVSFALLLPLALYRDRIVLSSIGRLHDTSCDFGD
ncbi:hypothetical protein E2C01_078447 [Portunus trituberculatus]|uniref:Uncharacterized protein n=1 Tax=Portunus trituberculatus TaxID=210409 RepID=A0A5B7IEB5_PORTR|nr:hypothetical protein [Portunus trituberculatus]